ncbi:MAG: TolC family protein [Gemmatimonadaceae bacterium]
MIRANFRTAVSAVVTGAVLAAAPLVSNAQATATSQIGAPMASDGAQPISLGEAVAMAQKNALGVTTAHGQERSAVAAHKAAVGAFFPTVDLSLGNTHKQGVSVNSNTGLLTPIAGTPYSYSNQLSVAVDVFDGGRKVSELKRISAVAEAANISVITARFDAALQTKQQFYAALAARESEAAARAQLEQADQQLKASTARVSAGVATKSDSLRSIIQVGNAQLAVLTAQNDLRVANAALTRAIGSTSLVTANPSDTATLPTTNVTEEDLARLVPDAPSIQLSEANLNIANAAKRTQKAAYFPTVRLSYSYIFSQASNGYSFGNVFLPFQQNPNQQQLGLSVSYSAFNGFTREAAAANSSIAIDNAEATLRDSRLAARANLTSQLRSLNNANARVQVQLQSIAAAEEDLRVQQQRYALGASTLLDLLTSQTQLNTARQALIQARFDARNAKAQLESLLGREL